MMLYTCGSSASVTGLALEAAIASLSEKKYIPRLKIAAKNRIPPRLKLPRLWAPMTSSIVMKARRAAVLMLFMPESYPTAADIRLGRPLSGAHAIEHSDG